MEELSFADFRKNQVIRDLILILTSRVGNKVEYSNLANTLGISRETLSKYISFLESTYLIKLIRPYSKNKSTEISKTPKVYFCDCGLVNAFAKVSEGALF